MFAAILSALACADKAPPARFPDPEPPELAKPLPTPVQEDLPAQDDVPAQDDLPAPARDDAPAQDDAPQDAAAR
ncbi:MAG: hypothetical protein KC431_10075 [Myxococcales bacterium]|nr:hypothetical protein [Myxococcales bacterium]MCA9697859.1 hypothetical protein [Myxococcales bacterium]